MRPPRSEQPALRVGALVIGSLFWERERWSQDIVDFAAAIDVAAPIRYGRISQLRDRAYTMIVSPGTPPGNGKVVPFLRPAMTASDVFDAAEQLAAAERLPRTSLSSSWGCIGMLTMTSTGEVFAEEWRQRMRGRATQVRAGYANTTPPIDEDGVVAAELCPAGVDGFDLLFVTVTTPTPPLPSAQQVVVAMNADDARSKGLRYFRENTRHGITTFQDAEIAAELQARGAP